ncbi:MAG TPA: hypothetical protein PKC76_16330 [Saprospiraceae bacterium]|nr:hypothetical protein [Saprospiraceae bacterium]
MPFVFIKQLSDKMQSTLLRLRKSGKCFDYASFSSGIVWVFYAWQKPLYQQGNTISQAAVLTNGQ